MANKKKGQLTSTSEWAKHLRKYLKRQFWKGERNASNESVQDDAIEADNLIWQFEEFIKTLIVISMPYENQKEYYGFAITADEMALDFDSFYTLNKVRYIEKGLISSEANRELAEINNLLDKWSSEKKNAFWYEMENYQEEWDTLRKMAKLALIEMGKNNLTVVVNHTNSFDEKGNINSQLTKTYLREK